MAYTFREGTEEQTKSINRALENRSHLLFEFSEENDSIKRVFLPMLENCQITESQNSNLGEYSLIGRNNNLFSYTSSKSREFKVSFFITHPHIQFYINSEGLDNIFKKYYSKGSRQDQISRFFSRLNSINGLSVAGINRNYYLDLAKQKLASDTEAAELILFWINIIRSSTKNNSEKTSFGPPIVRLTHGSMYLNVPCVAKSYSISFDETNSTFDLETLINRRIKVDLTLAETRVGNFGKYVPQQAVQGDNNTGWEAIFDNGTMDPFNGLIR